MIEKHEPPHRYARLIACIKFQRRRLLGPSFTSAMLRFSSSAICALAHVWRGLSSKQRAKHGSLAAKMGEIKSAGGRFIARDRTGIDAVVKAR